MSRAQQEMMLSRLGKPNSGKNTNPQEQLPINIGSGGQRAQTSLGTISFLPSIQLGLSDFGIAWDMDDIVKMSNL